MSSGVPDQRHSPELSDEQHREVAQDLLRRWRGGEKKSNLEIETWSDPTSHGKRFTSYVKKWTGQSTEKKSSQTEELERLYSVLRSHGISPEPEGSVEEEYRLLSKSREAALCALRTYNDPLAKFRTEAFILQMVVAWNTLMMAILVRAQDEIYEVSEEGEYILQDGRRKAVSTWNLMDRVLVSPHYSAVHRNLDFFLRLRNVIAHQYLPALDQVTAGEAQAMLLNYENLLADNFGPNAGLGSQLAVPLQLSGFRNNAALESLKAYESQLPVDVISFLATYRRETPPEILNSPSYNLAVYLVPVAANNERTADAVVRFIKLGEVTPELEERLQKLAIVDKLRLRDVASKDLLRVSDVIKKVAEAIPYKFNQHAHTKAWRYYKPRPPGHPSADVETVSRYCVYDALYQNYGYTQAWVDYLVSELSDPAKFEAVVEKSPEPK